MTLLEKIGKQAKLTSIWLNKVVDAVNGNTKDVNSLKTTIKTLQTDVSNLKAAFEGVKVEPYSGTEKYKKPDVVKYNGASYMCRSTVEVSNILPTDTDTWLLLANKGKDGQPGSDGKPGSPGVKGDSGILLTGALVIKDDTGDSTTAVMSQHAVTEAISQRITEIDEKISDIDDRIANLE